MNKQNRNRLIATKNRLMVSRGVGVGGAEENGEGIEKYKRIVTKLSRGCKVEHREYSLCVVPGGY